jgi:hypothetical protein
MRIVSVQVFSVARVLAIAYAVFGLIIFFLFAVRGTEQLTLPVGILAPLVWLNLNIHFERSTNVLYNIFLPFAAAATYGLTGWLTGAAAALCFNVAAKHTGGIDAKYVTTVGKTESKPVVEENHPITAIGE